MKKALLNTVALMLLGLLPIPGFCQSQSQNADVIVVDGAAPAHDFNHFWEEMFGSGRAVLALRDNYRKDLRQVKEVTDLKYVRFHGIFHDEVGVYSENEQGQPEYNFSYVDQIYDGLLAAGVRPFVELSFMPKALAAKNMPHAFWYKPDISPPKDWAKWDALIAELAKHLIARYGIDEVRNWYFEVWNEPNLDFWGGDPKQSTYWELYDHTAKALKGVSSRLRVGGPATAQAAWADAFIAHCAANHVPVDFVSSHVYGNDKAEDVFGTHEVITRDLMVCRAVKKVHEQIKASAMPNLPLIWSEFNASYFNETDITDSTYMGPWMADTIRQCDGLVDMMSYWTFSDVFEEQGVVKTPFYGGFGLIAADDIPKPAFDVFKLLHQLGNQRIELGSDSALLTRRKDGVVVLALWNYALPAQGSARTVTLELKNLKTKHVTISRVDRDHGDYHAAYEKMGSPRYPTAAQVEMLRQASALGAPEKVGVKNNRLSVNLPAQGLALIEFGR
jgi:xylan 1,4-beta-xylosidase